MLLLTLIKWISRGKWSVWTWEMPENCHIAGKKIIEKLELSASIAAFIGKKCNTKNDVAGEVVYRE